jgi:hypothetical protein
MKGNYIFKITRTDGEEFDFHEWLSRDEPNPEIDKLRYFNKYNWATVFLICSWIGYWSYKYALLTKTWWW